MAEGYILSAYDFQVYSAGGETVSRIGYRINITAAVFLSGEPVVDDGSGEATSCLTDPPNVLGIAAEPAISGSNRMSGLEAVDIGNTRRLIDLPTRDKRYVARYFSTDSTNWIAPTQANAVGVSAGFLLTGGNWGVDTNAANTHVVIEDVIDANGITILDDAMNPGAGDRVIFRFL